MPTITIECSNCGHDEETTEFEIDDFCVRCEHCMNDACKNCRDKDHPTYHSQCWKDAQGDEKEK